MKLTPSTHTHTHQELLSSGSASPRCWVRARGHRRARCQRRWLRFLSLLGKSGLGQIRPPAPGWPGPVPGMFWGLWDPPCSPRGQALPGCHKGWHSPKNLQDSKKSPKCVFPAVLSSHQISEEEDLQSSAEGIQEDLRKQKAPQKDPNGGEGWLGSS